MTNKKQLLNFPDYFITKDGQVFKGDSAVSQFEKGGIKYVWLNYNGHRFQKPVQKLIDEVRTQQYNLPENVRAYIDESLHLGLTTVQEIEEAFDVWL